MNDTLVGIQIRISTLRCLELLKMKKKKKPCNQNQCRLMLNIRGAYQRFDAYK